jgi:hypothetical protein
LGSECFAYILCRICNTIAFADKNDEYAEEHVPQIEFQLFSDMNSKVRGPVLLIDLLMLMVVVVTINSQRGFFVCVGSETLMSVTVRQSIGLKSGRLPSDAHGDRKHGNIHHHCPNRVRPQLKKEGVGSESCVSLPIKLNWTATWIFDRLNVEVPVVRDDTAWKMPAQNLCQPEGIDVTSGFFKSITMNRMMSTPFRKVRMSNSIHVGPLGNRRV